jgi:hypothetical protein
MESSEICPSFWSSTLGQNWVRAVPFLLFSYCCSRYSSLEFSCSEIITLGLVMFSWLCFQMNMDNYPHVTIAEDGSLCSTGQHRPGFPRMLYATTATFLSTVVACLRSMVKTGVRSA